MDNLKSLLDSKQYDLVLKLTETSTSSNDLFYRISAFIFLGKYEEALRYAQKAYDIRVLELKNDDKDREEARQLVEKIKENM